MRKLLLLAVFCSSVLSVSSKAQNIQVNRDNKSIYVSAEGEAKAEAEIVTLTIGYHSWGKSKDELYDQAANMSERVVAALLDAGVKKEMVRTASVQISRVEQESDWPSDWKSNRVFEVKLAWYVTVPAGDGEGVVAVAMKAGATDLDRVSWDVVDRTKIQAEAGKNALEKARTVAASMAAGLNARLGALVYASNTAPIRRSDWPFFGTAETSSASLKSQTDSAKKPKVIKLFPEKIEEKTTVYAVFAIE